MGAPNNDRFTPELVAKLADETLQQHLPWLPHDEWLGECYLVLQSLISARKDKPCSIPVLKRKAAWRVIDGLKYLHHDLTDNPDELEQLADSDVPSTLSAELQELPPLWQHVIKLRWLDGRTVPEAARALGCSSRTVERISARIRERLCDG